MARISLTGIKPTGSPHVGNYFGMYKQAIALSESYLGLYFVADYHALTTTPNPKDLQRDIYEVAAAWIALGLDPEKSAFFRQSDIPEIPECAWILACSTAKGLLNRAHAYKAAIDKNLEIDRDPDYGVNAGLYNYPVLMAADILLYNSDIVPVGADQRQHVEIARDIAETFNRSYGNIIKLPEAHIPEEVQVIPGIDGRKMSKSYNNIVPIFAPEKEIRKQIMRIVTDSKTPEEPKDPESCNVFQLFRFFASKERLEEVRQLYLQGGLGYGKLKQELFESLIAHFAEARQTFDTLMSDKAQLDAILKSGAEKVRAIATPNLKRMREAVGIDR